WIRSSSAFRPSRVHAPGQRSVTPESATFVPASRVGPLGRSGGALVLGGVGALDRDTVCGGGCSLALLPVFEPERHGKTDGTAGDGDVCHVEDGKVPEPQVDRTDEVDH